MNITAHKKACRQTGFTLIELIVVIAIIAILAGVAYPSYKDYVYKARHSDAYDCLVDAAQRQEEFFYNNNTYTTNLVGLGLSAAAGAVSCGDGGSYTLTAAPGTTGIGSSYILTATRAGAQTGDTKCGDLTLSNIGVQGNVGGSQPASKCW